MSKKVKNRGRRGQSPAIKGTRDVNDLPKIGRISLERRAAELFSMGQLAEAARIIEELVAAAPEEFQYRYSLGVTYLQAKMYGRCLDVCNAITSRWSVEGLPEEFVVLYLRCTRLSGFPEAGLRYVKSLQGRQIASFSENAKREIVLLLRSINPLESRIADLESLEQFDETFRVERARQLYRSGRAEVALTVLQEVKGEHRETSDFALLYSTSLIEVGDFDESRSYLRSRPMLNSSADLMVNLALCQQYRGELSQAAETLRRARTISPANPSAAFNLALICYATGAYSEGLQYLKVRNGKGYGGRVDKILDVSRLSLDQGFGEQILFLRLFQVLSPEKSVSFVGAGPRSLQFFMRQFPGLSFERSGSLEQEAQNCLTLTEFVFGCLARQSTSRQISEMRGRIGDLRCLDACDRRSGDAENVVGLSWLSSSKKYGALKSLAFSQLLELVRDLRSQNYSVVSLHSLDECLSLTPAEIEAIHPLMNWPLDSVLKQPLDEVAVAISRCKAVVSVCNTNAHIAGVLGKPLIVLRNGFAGIHWYWVNAEIYKLCYPRATVIPVADWQQGVLRSIRNWLGC